MNKTILSTTLVGLISIACQGTAKHDDDSMKNDASADQKQPNKVVAKVAESAKYDQPGFSVYEADGRLWVFKDGSAGHKSFLEHGEPAKCITKIGVGPDGKTVKGSESSEIEAYLAVWPSKRYAIDGFTVYERDGRLWVFKNGSKGLEEFLKHGEPAKNVTKIGVGPDRKTLKGADTADLDAYLAKVPSSKYGMAGYSVYERDGRLWVFRTGSEGHKTFLEHGEPAKNVTKIAAGPDGKTVKGADSAVLDAYIAAAKK